LAKRHFTPALFAFLRELEENNEKSWWDRNKERYLETVQTPALDFIADFAPRLAAISPHFTADTRTVGGSLMRPYRDIRFSPDKTPYKTNVGIQFRHESGKDIHAPGFYLHLEPAGSFAGVGLWRPNAEVASRIRAHIAERPDDWGRATATAAFAKDWKVERDEEEMLKRVPREFDADAPHADDLRLRSFIASARLSQKEVTTAGFDSRLGEMFSGAADYTRFLCAATGTPF
jgi:uncharacterized protein (TIGR02453 family)